MKLDLTLYQAIELYNLQHGLYAPLERFMGPSDLEGVLSFEFPLPILLTVSANFYSQVKAGDEIDLYFDGFKVGFLHLEEKSKIDLVEFAMKLYKDRNHPGLPLFLSNHTPYLLSGKVNELSSLSLSSLFRKKGWRSVAAFQTRNIPHIGHERVQRYALEITDGLILTPVLGLKKPGDFRNEVIEDSYKPFYRAAYTPEEAILRFIFLNMRYLGGREAAFHAIVRKNMGATHFIVGRDHAGAGGYYKPYEAQEEVMSLDLGIEIIPVKEVLYCPICNKSVFNWECPHEKIPISGTQIRESILSGHPNLKFLREEVADVIMTHPHPFVDDTRDEPYVASRLLEEWKRELEKLET